MEALNKFLNAGCVTQTGQIKFSRIAMVSKREGLSLSYLDHVPRGNISLDWLSAAVSATIWREFARELSQQRKQS